MEKLYISRPPKKKVFHVFDENGRAVCGADISIDLQRSRFYINDVKENYDLKINEPNNCKKCHKYLVGVLSKNSAEQAHR